MWLLGAESTKSDDKRSKSKLACSLTWSSARLMPNKVGDYTVLEKSIYAL